MITSKKHVTLGLFFVLVTGISSTSARAEETNHREDRKAKFTLQCSFSRHGRDAEDRGDRVKEYTVLAQFEHKVTCDGGEALDDSDCRDRPTLEIAADGRWIYKDGARIFTNIIGTRIQAEPGPFKAVTLPRGALHTGPHYSDAILEIDNDESLDGNCFVFTKEDKRD